MDGWMDGWIGITNGKNAFFGLMDVVRRFVVVFGDCHTLFYFQTFVCLFGIYYLDYSAVRDCNAMTRDEQIFVWIFAPKSQRSKPDIIRPSCVSCHELSYWY